MARLYYAVVKPDGYGNLICSELLDTFQERLGSEFIPIQIYDAFMLDRKMWTGSEWVDNPNYVELE